MNILTKKVKQFPDSDEYYHTAIRGLNIKVGEFRLKVGKDVISMVDPRMANYDFDYGVIRGKFKLLGGQVNDAMVLVKTLKKEDGTTEDVTIVKCVFQKNGVGIDYFNLETRKWEKREIIGETKTVRITKVVDLTLDMVRDETTEFLNHEGDIKLVNMLLPENGTSSVRVEFWSGGNIIWYNDVNGKYVYGCRTEGIFEDRDIDAEKGMVLFDGKELKLADVTCLEKDKIRELVSTRKVYYVGPMKTSEGKEEIQILDLYDQHGCGTLTKEDKDYLVLCLVGGNHDYEFFQDILYNRPRKHDNI
jgi:hypothetical protein